MNPPPAVTWVGAARVPVHARVGEPLPVAPVRPLLDRIDLRVEVPAPGRLGDGAAR